MPECVRDLVAKAAFRALPLARVILAAGMVIVGSVPPKPGGGVPATLSTTMTPIAPTFWTFLTLTVKPHVPRSTSAILPFTARAFRAERGLQARPTPPG